jgi:hypothetical protein
MVNFASSIWEKLRSVNKKVWMVLLVLAIVVSAGGFYFWNRGVSFTNADFSFAAPSGWRQTNLEGTGLKDRVVASVYNRSRSASFHVTAAATSGKIDFVALPKALKKAFLEKVKGFTELGVTVGKLDGYEALHYRYRYQDTGEKGEVVLIRQEQVIVQVGKKVFYLVAQANEENYEKMRDGLAEIFTSFDFK